MIVTLSGKNSFLLNRRLEELSEKFLAEQDGLAMEKIDAGEAGYEAILDAVASVPFLADKKMVIVRDLSTNKRASDNIEQIISSTAPTTELVIVEPSTDKRTAYYKALKASTQLEEYDDMDEPALAKWLVSEAKNLGASLTLGDANYLIDRLGNSQMLLHSELQKLATFSNEITRENINSLTVKNPQSKIFDLLDATFSGNKQKALALYEEQRAQKVEPQNILALIAWQLQLMTLAKYGKDKTAAQIAKDAKLNPYPVQKAQNLAAKVSQEKLAQMVADALEIDYKSKTSAINLDEALKTYITML